MRGMMAETVPPTVKAVNHVVGAPVESHVLLECIVEVCYKSKPKQPPLGC